MSIRFLPKTIKTQVLVFVLGVLGFFLRENTIEDSWFFFFFFLYPLNYLFPIFLIQIIYSSLFRIQFWNITSKHLLLFL